MSKLYYGIGKIPPGYKAATAKEALAKGEVRRWGQYKINPKLLHNQNLDKMKSVAQNFTSFYKENYPKLKAQGYTDGEADDILVDYWDSHDGTKYTTESMGHLRKSIPIKHVFGEPVMNKTEEIIKLRKELSDLNKAIQTERQPSTSSYEQETGGWGSTYRNTMEELNEESELFTGRPYSNYENYDIYDVGDERNIEEEQIIDVPEDEYLGEFIINEPTSKELVNLSGENPEDIFEFSETEWENLRKTAEQFNKLQEDYLRNPYSSPKENFNNYLMYLNIKHDQNIVGFTDPKNVVDFAENRDIYIQKLGEALGKKIINEKEQMKRLEGKKTPQKKAITQTQPKLSTVDKLIKKYNTATPGTVIKPKTMVKDLEIAKNIIDSRKNKSYELTKSILQVMNLHHSLPEKKDFEKDTIEYYIASIKEAHKIGKARQRTKKIRGLEEIKKKNKK